MFRSNSIPFSDSYDQENKRKKVLISFHLAIQCKLIYEILQPISNDNMK